MGQMVSDTGFDPGSVASAAGDALSGAAGQVQDAVSGLGGLGGVVDSIGGFAASLFGKE
jgi:hypothetical protein